MFSVPVCKLLTPADPVLPVQLPVMFSVPVEALSAPLAVVPLPPVQLPVMFSVPVEAFCAPALEAAPEENPPSQLPVMLSVPLDVLTAPLPEVVKLAVQFPTIFPTAGDAAVNCKQFTFAVADLLLTLAVSVTPLLSVKMPVPALETSSQVTSAVMVIVCPVDARASSPTVGTTPPTHVAPALKLPLAADTMSAMAYSPFAWR
jgi:hypothetical protein